MCGRRFIELTRYVFCRDRGHYSYRWVIKKAILIGFFSVFLWCSPCSWLRLYETFFMITSIWIRLYQYIHLVVQLMWKIYMWNAPRASTAHVCPKVSIKIKSINIDIHNIDYWLKSWLLNLQSTSNICYNDTSKCTQNLVQNLPSFLCLPLVLNLGKIEIFSLTHIQSATSFLHWHYLKCFKNHLFKSVRVYPSQAHPLTANS